MSEVTEKKERTSPEEFVRTWERAKSAKEVAQKFGTTVQSVTNRAKAYREGKKDAQGNYIRIPIPLKEMKDDGRSQRINVDKLLSIIEEVRAENANTSDNKENNRGDVGETLTTATT